MAFAGKLMDVFSPENRAKFRQGFEKDFNIGREDLQQVMYEARDRQGLGKEAPMGTSFVATHPGIYRVREAMGTADPKYVQVRNERDLGLSEDPSTRAGQFAGSLAKDIVDDGSRGFWWLINAPQAVGNLANDYLINRANRQAFHKPGQPYNENLLFGKKFIEDEKGNRISRKADKKAKEMGLLKEQAGKRGDTYAPGVSIGADPDTGEQYYVRRNFKPGALATLAIPTGFAINNAIGLMSPFGGAEGYKAISPSEEDRTKTDNVALEVATKYLLGQTGGLLPYDEFVKVRPDVSPEQYKAYKAFKGSRGTDLDISDGDISLPTGVAKFTDEGIHGPEIQFMGKSLPIATGIMPAITAAAGTALGTMRPTRRNSAGQRVMDPVRGGLIGGTGGLAAGTLIGTLLEAERRRRNEIENTEQIY